MISDFRSTHGSTEGRHNEEDVEHVFRSDSESAGIGELRPNGSTIQTFIATSVCVGYPDRDTGHRNLCDLQN